VRLPVQGLLALAFLAVGIAGKSIAPAPPEGYRSVGGTQAVASQLLGGLRAVPLIALWDRAIVAGQRHDWVTQTALFDVISSLTARSAAVTAHQAKSEALSVSEEQPDRAAAWAWVERGLHRLDAGLAGSPDPARLDEAAWAIGFYSGNRFPAEYAGFIAERMGDEQGAEEAAKLGARLRANPAAMAFLDGYGTRAGASGDAGEEAEYWLGAAFGKLSDEAKAAVLDADMLRWRAMRQVADRGIGKLRGPDSTLVMEYCFTLRRMARWTGADGAATLRAEAARALSGEAARLSALGDREAGERFMAEALEGFRGWVSGTE
jgi:hypothetical protein